MNKKSTKNSFKKAEAIIASLIMMILIIIGVYCVVSIISPFEIIPYSGYAISGKQLTENLINTNNEIDEKNVELLKFEEQDMIFKRLSNYYLGAEGNPSINIEYPFFINDKTALYNLSEKNILITDKFEELDTYPRLILVGGMLYNESDLERADQNEYIFIKNQENVFINQYQIKIKTHYNTYEIPNNSMIYFSDNTISYYIIKNESLMYNKIEDIDLGSEIEIKENKQYIYEQLLIKLRLKESKKNIQESLEEQEKTEESIETIKENPIENEEQDETEELQEEIQDNSEDESKDDEENQEINEEQEEKYIKPEVKCTNFEANVYSAKATINIKDPSNRIKTPVTFEFTKKGKTYLRKSIISSGQVEIIGLEPNEKYNIKATYTFLNEEEQKVQKEILNQDIETKGIDTLDPVELSFQNGEIFSKKIQIKNLKISSDLTSETLKGIKRFEVQIQGTSYKVSNTKISELLIGKSIIQETTENLPSDSNINYSFKIFDLKGNELKIINSSGTSRTAKMKPTISVIVKKQDISEVEISLNLTNRDNATIENYRYILFDARGDKVKEGVLQEGQTNLKLQDLDPNRYYEMHVYCDYDINDERGMIKDEKIGSCNFTSVPLSKLGYLYLNIELQDITKDSATLSLNINSDRTDSRFTYVLQEVYIDIYTEKDDEDSLVQRKIIDGAKLEEIKSSEKTQIIFNEINSNTKYYIKFSCKVKQGSTEELLHAVGTIESFITNKKPVEVYVRNQFVTESMIDFDVKINDEDGAMLTEKARLEVRDEKNKLVKMEYIDKNEDYVRLNYTKLEEKANYTIKFYADQYNEGSTDATYKSNYLLKTIELFTEPGVSGNIGLTNLQRIEKGKNLVDVNSEVKWYSNVFNINYSNMYYDKTYNEETGEFKIYAGKNGYGQYYVYDLRKYKGQTVTISFKAKKDIHSEDMTVYLQNSKTSSNRTKINGITTDNWTDYKFTVNVDSSGYIGFYIVSSKTTYEQYLLLKELQIELGNNKSSYKPYEYEVEGNVRINLTDKRDEIIGKDYYVKVIEEGAQKSLNHYIEIGENGKVEDAIKTYNFKENKKYELQLVVNIRERFYTLYSTEFSTEGEIKGISNNSEYLEIQPFGNYIILEDIDLTNVSGSSYRFGNSQFGLKGKIDFQGHKLILAYKDQEGLFYKIERTGIIENVVLEFYLNNTLESNYYRGLVTNNYGTIKNISVTLKQCNELGNIAFCLMGYANYGTVENFIVNFEVPLYGARSLTGGFLYNYGYIRNGYLYGEDIQATFSIAEGQARDSAGLVWYNNRGIIQNVYSLMNVISAEQEGRTENSASIVSRNYRGTVQNVYSVGQGSTVNLSYGPTVGTNESGRVYNAYYFCDTTFKNTFNMKTTKLALHDSQFQNIMLNSKDEFIVDDLITQKFYPHLKMSSKMPNQEFIPLPEVEDKDLVDILSTDLIEDNTTSVKIQLSINNPSGEIIKNIRVKEISSRILSQQYENGKTIMTVELSNPVHYISKYSIVSITSQGAFNNSYTRPFEEGERVVYVDLYRPIENIEDWKNINNAPTENYRLITDLDFLNCEKEIIITKTYSGKIDGDNHTIKNIKIPKDQGDYGLIYRISGEIKNLKVENYNKGNPKSNTYLAFISICDTNAIIDNVHIKNENLSSSITNSTNYTGGLTASATNTIIRNSSVTGLKIDISGDINNVRIGGLVGNGSNVTIENSYVQDLDINTKGALINYGIGGIIGRDSEDVVRYCYTTGNITTDGECVGGIIGYGGGTVESCYSTINIKSETDFIGGIIGYDTNTADANITRNLYLGNIYTNKLSTLVNRVQGNVTTDVDNYAYSAGKINGYTSTEKLGASELLTYSEIIDVDTYKTLLVFEEEFNYDGLERGILPKLYNIDGIDILPNQKDNTLENKEIYIKEVEAEKADANTANVRIVVNNPAGVEIEDVEIEYANVILNASVYDPRYGETYINLTVTPDRAYDSYTINKLICNINGEEVVVETEGKLNIQFYNEINSYEDWQKIDDYSAQNYRLNTDIDFSDKIDPKINVSIGRLESDSVVHTLKNLSIKVSGTSKGLIKVLKNSIRNIAFENITIENPANSGNYSGIIVRNTGTVENIKFKNINIQAPKIGYIGMIGYNSSINIKNVELEEITVSGREHVGGFIGLTDSGEFQYIDIKNANITATSTYSGSVIGRIASRVPYQITDITADDVHVNGIDRVGGIVGQGRIAKVSIKNSEVSGRDYIGGIVGIMDYHSTDNRYLVCQNCKITGTRNYTGGIAGQTNEIYAAFSLENEITGVSYVGGLTGTVSNEIRESGVRGCTIKATQNNAGGIAGYLSGTIVYSYSYNSTIEANRNAGGITGEYRSGYLGHSYTNNTTNAKLDSAGGIVGYLNNTEMTGANYVSRIYQNAVFGAKVTAPDCVGGIIGRDVEPLYNSSFYYNNYVDAYLTCDTALVSMGVGSAKSHNSTINRFYVYENSTINNHLIKGLTDNIPSANYIARSALKTSSTYTSKIGLSSSYFNFTRLSEEIYPLIHVSSRIIDYQDGIPFPSATPLLSLGPVESSVDDNILKDKGLPKINLYITGVNKINVEVENLLEGMQLLYKPTNGEENCIIMDNKTYTFNYDYQTEVELTLLKDLKVKKITIVPTEYINMLSTISGKTYYLKDGIVYSQEQQLEGKFVNLYKDEALDENGRIYNIASKTWSEEITKGFTLQEETKPIESQEYNGVKIDTYSNYSVITNGAIEIEKEGKILAADGNLALIDNTLNEKGIIIGNYNDNEYETILTEEGKLYDLKTPINYPENFVNKDIEQISTNNTDEPYVTVQYQNGKVETFDYTTGNIIFDNKVKKEISLIDYIKQSLSIDLVNEAITENGQEQYKQSEELKEKLEETPIEENTIEKYITAYDNKSKDYVVYKESELLNLDNQEYESENSKISQSAELTKFYGTNKKEIKQTTGLKWIVPTIVAVLISLVILIVRNRNKILKEQNGHD